MAAAAGTANVLSSAEPALAATVPWYDITDYGAIGNGSTAPATITANDNAIQNAINAASTAGGGVVYAPTGTYAVSATFSFPTIKPIDLVGSGRYETVFKCTAAGTGFRFGPLGTGGDGASTGMTGGFHINGNDVAWVPMSVAKCSNRGFHNIRITKATVSGLQLEATQNAVFEGLNISDCRNGSSNAAGLVLDYGAGGNLFTGIQLINNDTNLLFRNSATSPSTFDPYNGRPTDNKFVGGIIEGTVTNHVLHGAGVDNYFIGTRFAGSTCPRIKFFHQDVGAGFKGSYDLNLIGCYFVGGGVPPTGTGIEHTCADTTVRLVNCKFDTLATALVLGNHSWVEVDAFYRSNVTTRFANAPGATDSEESLVRRENFHTQNVTREAATSVAFRTWVGSKIDSRDTTPRYVVTASGDTSWGPGNAATDVTLKRSAAGILQASGKLTAVGGLGVGNSAAASTPGTVVKKIQVFDANGTSLGYIPVYNNIT